MKLATATFAAQELPEAGRAALATRLGRDSLLGALVHHDRWAMALESDGDTFVVSIRDDPDLPRRLEEMSDEGLAMLVRGNIAKIRW